MKSTTTFEENPANSPEYVQELLEAGLNCGFSKLSLIMQGMINMWGSEKNGVERVKDILNDFKIYINRGLVPTAEKFEEFLLSTVHNHATGYIMHPIAKKEARLFPISQIPSVTMPKKLEVTLYGGVGFEEDFPDLDGGKPPDLFAKLSIKGLLVDERKVKTEVKKNCWTPSWAFEIVFLLYSPKDAFLHVDVYDHDIITRNDFAGTVSLPVSELRMGTKAVPLYDQKGVQYSAARLIMHFMFV